MDFLQTLADSMRPKDEAEGRFYGFLYGIITDVDDPDGLGRVRARIGAMGPEDSSDWLIPAWPGAIEALPNKKDAIIVGFIDGDPNRGFYLVSPRSTTKDRPTEAMLLATTFIGMYNHLVAQFNQLRTDYNSHAHQPGSLAAPSGGGAVTGTSGAPTASTTAAAASKGKAADGSVVAAKSSSEKVLSGKTKVR